MRHPYFGVVAARRRTVPPVGAQLVFDDLFEEATTDEPLDVHDPNLGTGWELRVNNGDGRGELNARTATSTAKGVSSASQGSFYSTDFGATPDDTASESDWIHTEDGDEYCYHGVRVDDVDAVSDEIDSGYFLRFTQDSAILRKCVSGTWSDVGTAEAGIGFGSIVGMTVEGDNPATIKWYVDYQLVATRTDSDLDGGGSPGIGVGHIGDVTTADVVNQEAMRFRVWDDAVYPPAELEFLAHFSGTNELNAYTPEIGQTFTRLIQNNGGIISANNGETEGNDVASAGVLYVSEPVGGFSSADYQVRCYVPTMSALDDLQVLAVRVQDSSNFIALEFLRGNGQLWNVVGGTWNQLGADFTVYDGDVIELEVEGSAVRVRASSHLVSSQTQTDHTAAGKVGIGGGNLRPSAPNADMLGQSIEKFMVRIL